MELMKQLIVGYLFSSPNKRVAGIIHDHIDVAEITECRFYCSADADCIS